MAYASLSIIGTATYSGSEYNLIWEDDNNGKSLVWLDYTNSNVGWSEQVAWASNIGDELTINLYDGYTITWNDDAWRLPATVDGAYEFGYGGTTTGGYNITTSELGFLFYEELGNTGSLGTDGSIMPWPYGLKNTELFENLLVSRYWSGTEYATDTTDAWSFCMDFGVQINFHKTTDFYGLAVRSGRVSVSSTPIPGTSLLLGAGLLGLAGVCRRKRR
nr:hypothetical protein [uncultured Desulfobacter sp.]